MRNRLITGCLVAFLAVSASWADPLGTAFTYQGRLKNGGSPANGLFNMVFKLYPDPAGGTLLASQTLPGVSVSDGLFTVQVDFGAGAFDGNQRWLDVTVDGTPLVPRQELTAAPHAVFASNADQLDGLNSTQFLQSIPNPLTLSGSNASHIIRGENASSANGATGVSGISTAAGNQTYGGHFESSSPSGFGVYGGGGLIGLYGESFNTSGSGYGGYFQSPSTGGVGVLGYAYSASGTNYGGHFRTDSTSGRGVFGFATAATGTTHGMWGQSDSSSGRGVYGFASAGSGTTFGGSFETSSAGTNAAGVFGLAAAFSGNTTYGGSFETRSSGTDAAGVFGLASNSSGTTCGVYGRNASPDGRGVYGLADAVSGNNFGGSFETKSNSTSAAGVFGLASAINGFTPGVWGKSNSIEGIGVLGTADSGIYTYGVYGVSASNFGRGVYGLASAETGRNFGGSFETRSTGTDATGVFGLASAFGGTTYGVWGQSESTSGFGVIGINPRTSGTTFGVYGRTASPAGWSVYADGRFGASGTKSFRIDHPDDPENKYLLHYAAESPEVINFYRGSALLDGAGQAVVELPHYFAKINKTPSYQLTAVGAPMPMLHIAEKISDDALNIGANAEPGEAAPICSFRIAGGAPGGEVSWEVKAVRNDRWVQQGGAPVEVEKMGVEKGTYQHPELYGQPPEKGMNYDAERERPSHERPSHPAVPAATSR